MDTNKIQEQVHIRIPRISRMPGIFNFQFSIFNCFILAVCFMSCGKDEPKEEIIRDLISATLETTTVYQGDTVVIKGKSLGKNLGADPSQYILTIEGVTYPLKSVADDEITFVVPEILDDYEQKREVKLYLKTKGDFPLLNQEFIIQFKEPKEGWFYQSKIRKYKIQEIGSFLVTKDATMWIAGTSGAKKSRNAGQTWEDVTSLALAGVSFLDQNTGWLLGSFEKFIYYTNNGKDLEKFDITHDQAIGKGSISNIWADAYNSGVVVYNKGLVLGIDDFTGKLGSVNVLYDSQNPKNVWLDHISVNSKYEFVLAGHYTSNSYPKPYFIVFKADGDNPNEYTAPEYISKIQLLKNKTVYFCGETGNFYRITWPFQIEKLAQKATIFHFVDDKTGYAIYEQDIYKTTDGQNWKKDFTIKEGLKPLAICEHAGHVWIALDNTKYGYEEGEIAFLKYNPENN